MFDRKMIEGTERGKRHSPDRCHSERCVMKLVRLRATCFSVRVKLLSELSCRPPLPAPHLPPPYPSLLPKPSTIHQRVSRLPPCNNSAISGGCTPSQCMRQHLFLINSAKSNNVHRKTLPTTTKNTRNDK